jgi:pilus assembly protein CpaB
MAGGRERGALFLIASIMGALGVTMMIYNLIQEARDRTKQAQKPEETVEVVVAATNIAPGWTIKADHLQTRVMPETWVPREVKRTPEQVIGRVAQERVLFGEFLREERLADPESGTGMTAIIPRGMRAYQVQIANGDALSGFLNPGNFVDLIAVCPAARPPEVRTLLTSVQVLAVRDKMVDDSYDEVGAGKKKKRSKPSVTIAITPEQVEMVKHATRACEITLTLRNDIDVTNISSNDVSPDDLPEPEGPSAPSEFLPEEEMDQSGWVDPSRRLLYDELDWTPLFGTVPA